MKKARKVNEIIKKKPYLIWYVKDYDALDDAAVVEAVLNYGDWDDVRELIKILGIKNVAKIFKKQTSGWRTNYDKKIINYFNLYFHKHAKNYA